MWMPLLLESQRASDQNAIKLQSKRNVDFACFWFTIKFIGIESERRKAIKLTDTHA